MTVITELRQETGKDNSIVKSFNLDLPRAWLLSAMGLRLRDGHGPTYVDSSDIVRFMDPSLKERGASAGIVDRNLFLSTVEAAGLEAIWLVAGEKSVYSSDSIRHGFGGRVTHVMAYLFVNGMLVSSPRRDFKLQPSAEQMKGLLTSHAAL